MKESSLGRGLSALIPKRLSPSGATQSKESTAFQTSETIESLPVDRIDANPHQPRRHFDYQALEELTSSIKAHGILQPLIVSRGSGGRFELITGERRLRAAKILNLKTVPAVIRDVTTQSKLELALIENIQRKDLNPMEEAEAYQALIDEFGLTQDAVAERVGRNRVTVANALRLLQLSPEIQKSLRDGRITAGHAKVILSAPGPKDQLALWRKILTEDLSVRAGEAAGRHLHRVKPASAPSEPILYRFEDALRRKLNTRVKIKRQGKGGLITIDFYSQAELENIIEKISGE